jgi:hypothetical protein
VAGTIGTYHSAEFNSLLRFAMRVTFMIIDCPFSHTFVLSARLFCWHFCCHTQFRFRIICFSQFISFGNSIWIYTILKMFVLSSNHDVFEQFKDV